MQLTGKACEIKSQVGRRSNTIELTHPRHSDFFKRWLHAMTREERWEAVRALFPDHWRIVAHAMDRFELLGQRGHSAFPFRYPRRRAALASMRTGFMVGLLRAVQGLDLSLHDLARYAGWFYDHRKYTSGTALPYFFAAAIDLGDSELIEVMKSCARGEDEIGIMADFIPVAFLLSNNEAC